MNGKVKNMLCHTYKRFQREDATVHIAFLEKEAAISYCGYANEENQAEENPLRASIIWGLNYEKKDLVWHIGWTVKKQACFD